MHTPDLSFIYHDFSIKIVSESYHILLYKCLAWRNSNVIKFRIDFAGFFEDLLLSRAGCPHLTVL